MKTCAISCVALTLLLQLAGCQTKVVNQPPAANGPMVIERDRPVVTERQTEAKPEVQNNIHVDR